MRSRTMGLCACWTEKVSLPGAVIHPVQMVWQHPELSVNPRLKMREVLREGDAVEERVVRGLGIEPDWLNRYPGRAVRRGAAAVLHSQGPG